MMLSTHIHTVKELVSVAPMHDVQIDGASKHL